MKKLKLSELNLGDAEVLSRKELKKVLGGINSGSGGGSGTGGSGMGSCTETCATGSNGSQSCTSIKGDCSHEENLFGTVTSISCDGTSYNC